MLERRTIGGCGISEICIEIVEHYYESDGVRVCLQKVKRWGVHEL